jgi:hypothetical protein
MKARRIAHWTATLLVISVMTVSGAMAITHAAPMMIALAHLGYPAYFSNLLGVAKLAGVCVLLAPGVGRLKEWAYTGFAITILSASYSHWRSGDGVMALEPLVTFAALVISYQTRTAGEPAGATAFASAQRECPSQPGGATRGVKA